MISVLTIGLAMPAIAGDLPKEGKYDYTACYAGTAKSIDFSKAYSGLTYDLAGTIRSNPPDGFLDMTTLKCVGFSNTIDGRPSGMNICQVVDKDGDKMLSKNIIEGSKQTSEALAGTGKYEGIVRTGAGESVGAFPAGAPGTLQGCTRNTGTYKMKLEATGSTTPPATTPSK
jgi:hypothetical protein